MLFIIQRSTTRKNMTRWQIWALSIILTVYQMSWSESRDTAAPSALRLNIPWRGITFPAELADTPGYVEAP